LCIGHELVARVVEVGAEVEGVRPGQRVVVPFQISCGACRACRRGLTSACSQVPWLSCYGLGALSGGWGGATADLVRVPYADAMLLPAPEQIASHELAALSCNVVDAYRAVGPQLALDPGAEVLVVGGAFANIAQYAVVLARALGAARVDFLARDRREQDRAARLGAHVLESTAQLELMRYPIVVDASMDVELMSAALTATARAGTCTLTTMYATPTTPLPLFELFMRGATLHTGQPHVRGMIEPVLDLITRKVADISGVVDSVLAWEDAPAAFMHGRGKLVCVRERG
jgi:alcohol dehydrogenase